MAGSSWSYETLREKAEKDWTLAGDDQVLRLMMKIGKNLESRTVAVTEQIDQMLGNVDRACIQLENVNNKLVALQKTHFFDHQIQEDDEEYLRPVPSNESIEANDKAKLSKANADEMLKKVLRDTVNAVDKCYEKIVLDWSDSILDEEDDVIGRTMIRPIDTYKDLPRPYLIGSDKWKKSQFVGLRAEKEVERPTPPTTLQTIPQPSIEGQSVLPSMEEKVEDYEASSSSTGEDQPSNAVHEPALHAERFFKPPDLSSDLPSVQAESRHEPDIQQQPSLPQIPVIGGFFDETPPMPSITVRKKPNLFADLEDDSDDDGGFATAAATPAVVLPKALPRGFNNTNSRPQVNIFDDEPPEMEERVSSQPPRARNLFDDHVDGETVSQKVLPEIRKKTNLFDDDVGEEEEDLFAAKAKSAVKVIPKPSVLHDEIKDRLEDVENNNNNNNSNDQGLKHILDENKNPVKSTQNDMFKQSMEEMLRKGIGGGNKIFPARISSRPTSIEKQDEEERKVPTERDVPEVLKKEPPMPQLTSLIAEITEPLKKKTTVSRGLFDDENEAEGVPEKAKSQKIIEKEVLIAQKPKKSKGLFDDDDSEVDDLFGPPPSHLKKLSTEKLSHETRQKDSAKDVKATLPKLKSRGLFDSTDDEDDLFKPKLNQSVEKKPETLAPKMSTSSLKVPAKSLFSDEEEDEDLFANKALEPKINSVPPKLNTKSSLFEDSEIGDEDLFGSTEDKKQESAHQAQTKAAEEEAEARYLKEKQEEIKRNHEENEKKRLLEAEKEKKAEIQKRMDLEKEISDREKKAEEEEQERQRKVAEQEKQEQELKEQERLKIKRELEEQEEEARIKALIDEKLAEEKATKKSAKEEERLAYQTTTQDVPEIVKKTSLFDDLVDDEDSFESDIQKPTTRGSYSVSSVALFDEPPEDHDYDQPTPRIAPKVPHFDNSESSDEDSLFSEKKPIPPKPQTVAVKKSIDLFSDLPPDDDTEDLFATLRKPTESVTQKTDVFYDDMAESFPPPPEQVTEENTKENVETPAKEEIGNTSAIRTVNKSETIQSVRDLIKSHENPIEVQTEPSIKKSLPNKLNTSIQINVNAFLPGARLPPKTQRMSSMEEKEPSEGEKSPVVDLDESSCSVATPGDPNVSQGSAVLSSLNKNRPKLAMKRRPSTRKGRQESLRRSQLFDSEDISEPINNIEAVTDPVLEIENNPVTKEHETPVEIMVTKHIEPVAVQIKEVGPPQKNVRKLFSSDDEDSDEDLFKPKKISMVKAAPKAKPPVKQKEEPKKQLSKKQSSLFSDENDSDEDLFSGTSSKAPTLPSISSKAQGKKEVARSSTDHNPLADLF